MKRSTKAMKIFFLIVIAGLGCAALGGGFGWLVGILSPEFIALLVQPDPVSEPERMGAALGLVSGLFLGAATMGFGLVVEALWQLAIRRKASKEVPTDEALHQRSYAEDGSSSFFNRPR
jgi:hypothetical protein